MMDEAETGRINTYRNLAAREHNVPRGRNTKLPSLSLPPQTHLCNSQNSTHLHFRLSDTQTKTFRPTSRPMQPSAMDTHQLLDSLTAHIALYHSSIPNPNTGPRATVLRWFFSLSAVHRQSVLTVLDPDFVRVLLQMLSHLRRHGHGFFFLLPDLPSPSSSLPSLCFRRSHGLLARAAAGSTAELTLARSLRLFGSREEGQTAECPLDSLMVSEDLVADADRFVEVMDGISGGRFLRGEVSGLGAPWAELPWLKDKGYYSLEAFVANRMEVGLRQAWLSSHGGKKPKVGKAAKEKAGVAGVAANAFWRKKGCLDWWMGLDPGQRKKIFKTFLGKAAKSLVIVLPSGLSVVAFVLIPQFVFQTATVIISSMETKKRTRIFSSFE